MHICGKVGSKTDFICIKQIASVTITNKLFLATTIGPWFLTNAVSIMKCIFGSDSL